MKKLFVLITASALTMCIFTGCNTGASSNSDIQQKAVMSASIEKNTAVMDQDTEQKNKAGRDEAAAYGKHMAWDSLEDVLHKENKKAR